MLHTSMDFFVKHIAYLTFLILAQKEKFVKLFRKKCLLFLFFHVIINILYLQKNVVLLFR